MRRFIGLVIVVVFFIIGLVAHHFYATDKYINAVISNCECTHKIPFSDKEVKQFFDSGESIFFKPANECIRALQEAKEHSPTIEKGVCEVHHWNNQGIDLIWGLWCPQREIKNAPQNLVTMFRQCNQ